MTKKLSGYGKRRALWPLSLLLILSFVLVPQLALPHSASAAATLATDNFNRADGGLGAGWTAISDGAMSIASQQVIGTVGQNTGEIRTGETYASDQFSQISVTSTALSGGQWIAAAVRMQNSGQNAYAGLYYWNFGSPELMLFLRTGGAWTQLNAVNTAALAAGTTLKLQAVGSTISFLVNGAQRLSVTDTTLTGGAPGIMAYGNATADNWAGQDATGTTTSYTVGGTVSGLSGTVVLQDNGGDNLSLSASGSFTFATPLAAGTAYSVTVATNPSGQTCTVTNGSGTIASANVTNVAVSCTNVVVTTYSVGGTVSGLSGTVVLQDNGGDNLSLSASGSFTFATPLAAGTAYSVTVATNPSGQTCTVTNGSGTIASANVTNVAVSCAATAAGTATDNFNRADGGLGAGWTAISDGAMSIASQQVIGTVGQTTGEIRTGETYASDQFSQISVTSTALSGGQWIAAAVRMQNSGQNAYAGLYYWNFGSPELMLFVRTGGAWTQLGSAFSSGVLAAGTQLSLQAVGSTISFLQNGVARITVTDKSLTGGAPGIMAYGNATADNWAGGSPSSGGGTTTYTVGGTVSGLSGTVVLEDNGADDLSLSASGSFTFATPVASGTAYNVTVKTSPASQNCTVTNGTGTIGAANVTNVAVSCANITTTPGSDNFNRSDGGLGPNWTSISDGAMSIASQQVVGTAGATTGDIRTAETYASDQYSQIEVTSTQLTGNQWLGAAVRMQSSGQNAYVGIYNWNSGSPVLQLFLRSGGSWSQLGNSYSTPALTAGTQLRLVAVGNTISFMVNGVQDIGVSDNTLSGGAPGIMANGAATGDNWAGSNTGFQVSYVSTSSSGVKSYNVISANNGYGPQTIRVLNPTSPAAGVAHNFLIVLPVEVGLGTTFGDGLGTLQSLNAQNQYNLTIIEPTFGIDSWDANNPNDPNMQYETFITQELVPWVKQNLATTGQEQTWLIGFSKSGLGVQDLILKHPDLFTLAASWDFPADMATYDGLGSDPAANYGTDANYQANYRLTQAFVDAHKTPFLSSNRIWIGGYSLYQTDVSDYGAILTSEGIAHSTETPQDMAHRWDSGWMPIALAALYQDSIQLP